MKNKAFTLTELLVAIGIVGTLAALSIPSMVTTVQNYMLATKLKGNIQSIKQLVDKQLMMSPTRDLTGTDFNAPEKLLTASNFNVVKVCTDSAKDCWKTTATTGKVQYYTINGSAVGVAGPSYYSAQLKNGTVIGYKRETGGYKNSIIGEFCLDINGPEKPNIKGRDYFCAMVTLDGKFIDFPTSQHNESAVTKATKCKSGDDVNYCYGAVVDSGWRMPY
ncbi:MAG: type II secretion system GspH family protein [Muribaculaceae bacterium]|nr:type II secretion system GspH family protein [Muribaculaceae bacterium]